MSLSFTAAARWWRDLQPDPDGKRPGDRAALARLRRCATVAEAMQEPATIALFRRCGGAGPGDLPLVALAAALLAHVRQDDSQHRSIARQVGPSKLDAAETALLKPLRFRRLMDAVLPDERLTVLRRLVALTGGTLNVEDLTASIFYWNERRRTRWVYDYWDAGQPTVAFDNKDSTP